MAEKIAALDDGWKSPGAHSQYRATGDYATGIYFMRIGTGFEVKVEKPLLLK